MTEQRSNQVVLGVMGVAFAGQAAGVVPHQWALVICFTLLACVLARKLFMVMALVLLVAATSAQAVCLAPNPTGDCAFSGITTPAGDTINVRVYVCDNDEVALRRFDGPWTTVTQDSELSYVARTAGDMPAGLGEPGKSCTICQGKNGTIPTCFGEAQPPPQATPQPTVQPTPAPTPIGAIPRIHPENKRLLGIVVDVGYVTASGMTVLATSFTGEGDLVSAAFAAATAASMTAGMREISHMVDDPYRSDYNLLAEPQPEPVPANVTNQLRREYIATLNGEAATAIAVAISIDRANSARQDGATSFEAQQVAHIRELQIDLGALLKKDANQQGKIAARWPKKFGSVLNDPDHVAALRAAGNALLATP
jgi:hypothetical protein